MRVVLPFLLIGIACGAVIPQSKLYEPIFKDPDFQRKINKLYEAVPREIPEDATLDVVSFFCILKVKRILKFARKVLSDLIKKWEYII